MWATPVSAASTFSSRVDAFLKCATNACFGVRIDQHEAPALQKEGPDLLVIFITMEAGRALVLYALAYACAEVCEPEAVKNDPDQKMSPVDFQFQLRGPPYELPPSLMRFVTCLGPRPGLKMLPWDRMVGASLPPIA